MIQKSLLVQAEYSCIRNHGSYTSEVALELGERGQAVIRILIRIRFGLYVMQAPQAGQEFLI